MPLPRSFSRHDERRGENRSSDYDAPPDAVPVGRRAPSVVATGESDRRERDIERCGRLGQPLIICGKRGALAHATQELDRRQVQRVQGPDREREGVEGARQDRRSALEEGQPAE